MSAALSKSNVTADVSSHSERRHPNENPRSFSRQSRPNRVSQYVACLQPEELAASACTRERRNLEARLSASDGKKAPGSGRRSTYKQARQVENSADLSIPIRWRPWQLCMLSA